MLIKELQNTREVKRIAEEIAAYRGWPIALFGASGSSRASASRLNEDLSFFMTGTDHFPRRDLTLRPVESFSRRYEYRRISTLGNIVGGRTHTVVASAEAALMYTMPRSRFIENTLTIRRREGFNRDELISRLVDAGYIRRERVEGEGQFAVRGDIIDLYTPGATI